MIVGQLLITAGWRDVPLTCSTNLAETIGVLELPMYVIDMQFHMLVFQILLF